VGLKGFQRTLANGLERTNAFERMTARSAVVAALVAVICCLLFTGGAVGPGHAAASGGSGLAAATELLPDLDPLEPRRVNVGSVDGAWALTFGAATDNLGDGPVMIHGERSDPSAPMQVTQLVLRSDGTKAVYSNVGKIVYVTESDHQHFHLLGFMTYELRDVATYRLVRPSQKTGFCVMDDGPSASYDPKHKPPNTPPKPVYTERCGLMQPNALTVDEGLSVGYGDYYNPVLEGQSIDLTGVSDGRYYLVVRSNQAGLIHESNYKNNGASVQLLLSHPSGADGQPAIKILAICRDGDHCLQPLTLRLSGGKELGRTTHSRTVRVTVSVPSTVDASLRVGSRVLSHLSKRLQAGGSSLVLNVPQVAHLPAKGTVVVRATGLGLQSAVKTFTVALG
jgi:Lysyl oxidase